MSWTGVAAGVAGLLLGVLVVFQVALACGVDWGRAAYGGRHRRLPARLRVASAVAAVLWTLVALLFLRRAGVGVWVPLPAAAVPVAAWALVGLFAVAVLLNAVTTSPLERAIWLPVSVLLLASGVIVANS